MRGKRSIIVLAITAAAVALLVRHKQELSHHRQPVTHYVSARGVDRGTCARPAPCASIAFASRESLPGDRVVVEHGVYGPQSIAASGTSRAPVTIEAKGWVVFTRPAHASDALQRTPLLSMSNVYHVIVRGFRLLGMKGRPDYVPSDYPGGDKTQAEVLDASGGGSYETYLTFDHLVVKHSGASCIKIPGHDTVMRSILVDCGRRGDTLAHGIYCAGGHDTILGNTIRGTSGYGIHCHGDTPAEVIRNNTVSGAHYGGILAEGAGSIITGNRVYHNGFGIEAGPRMTISHNVIAYNKTRGLLGFGLVFDSVGHDRVEGNTFYRNGFGELYLVSGRYVAPITVTNNVVDGTGRTDHFLNDQPHPIRGSRIDYNIYHNILPNNALGRHSRWGDPHVHLVLS